MKSSCVLGTTFGLGYINVSASDIKGLEVINWKDIYGITKYSIYIKDTTKTLKVIKSRSVR